VIFLTAGGVLTDRMDRRHMMIAADSLRAVRDGGPAPCSRSRTI